MLLLFYTLSIDRDGISHVPLGRLKFMDLIIRLLRFNQELLSLSFLRENADRSLQLPDSKWRNVVLYCVGDRF